MVLISSIHFFIRFRIKDLLLLSSACFFSFFPSLLFTFSLVIFLLFLCLFFSLLFSPVHFCFVSFAFPIPFVSSLSAPLLLFFLPFLFFLLIRLYRHFLLLFPFYFVFPFPFFFSFCSYSSRYYFPPTTN